jgi:hypothetical protein
MKKWHYLFHVTLYYLAWFSCIALAVQGYPWFSTFVVMVCVVLQIYWQYTIQDNTRGLWILLGLVVITSTLIDSLLTANGIIIYAANPWTPFVTAPWMIALWISFTVILYATLYSLFNYLLVLGLLSFTGFALAYAIGEKMGAVRFPYGYKTCFLIGAIWFIVLPLVVYGYKKIRDRK